MKTAAETGTEHLATAKALNLPISTKQSVMVSNALRFHSVEFTKKYLEQVLAHTQAIPFTRHHGDMGHKPGMSSGRYPEKAVREFLRLVKNVEANAQHKGLDAGSLKIVKLMANKASIPSTNKRGRTKTKRTHLEIAVQEVKRKIEKSKPEKITPKATVKLGTSAPTTTETPVRKP